LAWNGGFSDARPAGEKKGGGFEKVVKIEFEGSAGLCTLTSFETPRRGKLKVTERGGKEKGWG